MNERNVVVYTNVDPLEQDLLKAYGVAATCTVVCLAGYLAWEKRRQIKTRFTRFVKAWAESK